MRLFITGGSGWIGSATVPKLIAAGHDVVALARSDASAASLESHGAAVIRGHLGDLELLSNAAVESDGVLHLAFNHEIAFSGDFLGAATADRAAIEAMGDALRGSGRALVIASGTPVNLGDRIATEDDDHDVANAPGAEDPGLLLRAQTAEWTLGLADYDVRSAVVRLPPTNHGEGDHGFVAGLAQVVRAQGASGYIGEGAHRWSATHRLDTAELFRLAVESAPAGATLHAVAEEAIPTRTIAEEIGRRLDVPVLGVPAAEAFEFFGWLAGPFGADRAASSVLTRRMLDWKPSEPTLAQDIAAGFYEGLVAG